MAISVAPGKIRPFQRSMNYFFVSRNKKRIVLFACVQTMRTPQGNDEDDYFDETEEYEYGEI